MGIPDPPELSHLNKILDAASDWEYFEQVRPGDTITAGGTVTNTYESEGYGYVECQVALTNNRGETTASGNGKVVLPKRGQALPIEWAVENW